MYLLIVGATFARVKVDTDLEQPPEMKRKDVE
jgi:hypothetical protein